MSIFRLIQTSLTNQFHYDLQHIYSLFNNFLYDLEQNKAYSNDLENIIKDVLNNNKNNLLFSTSYLPSEITKESKDYSMSGFSYLKPLFEFPSIQKVIKSSPSGNLFLSELIKIYNMLDPIFKKTLSDYIDENEWELILKVWKFQNNKHIYDKYDYFVPPHFDRSILSIMYDSSLNNEFSKNLFIGKESPDTNIDNIMSDFNIDNNFFPNKTDYPIVTTGIHANYLNLIPAPHGVTPIPPNSGERLSFLTFIVPKKGLDTNIKTMSS